MEPAIDILDSYGWLLWFTDLVNPLRMGVHLSRYPLPSTPSVWIPYPTPLG